jgi:glycosyltransferase involved in cell wall biosynthesis
MNILLSIHHGLDNSTGAPGVTMKLAGALSERGHAVRIISFDDLNRLPGRLRGIVFPWMVFAHVLKHPEYDVLDSSSGDGWVVNFVRRAFGWRKRLLTVTRSHGLEHMGHDLYVKSCKDGYHTMSWKYPLYGGGYRLWECRQSFALADVSLLLNDSECEYAQRHFGVDGTRIAKVGNGISEPIARVAERLITQPAPEVARPINVAFVGRAIRWKGFPYLSEAMARILARYPASKLGLFGTGGTVEEVLSAFPDALRHRITVIPYYNNDDLPQLLADYQIFAFPSLSEGFGIAPLEAMACGLVPVVSDIPGPREYMRDGENGVVVPVSDARALEDAIAALGHDRARWLALRRGALATALQYSWSDLAARFELLYCLRRRHDTFVKT